ncbi:tyrosine phosphatase family protein [Pararhizobium haloflavum]|uniref:tyrosine phosphatase family protein n=1 Tax=Pararhizobium haloflavum TaxID=2037914 RepID=UPI000C17574D|nr:protein tyrosine phosphatase [Pararhizobium haloflavum]
MSFIVVAPLSRIGEVAARYGAGNMISLLGEGHAFHRPGRVPADRHLHIGVNDIDKAMSGLVLAQEDHVRAIVEFARRWDRGTPLLVHCWMGISRSPAAALIAALACNPEQDDAALAQRLRRAAPAATPNSRLIAIGDEALGRGGALVAGVAAIGRGADAMEGEPFRFDIAAGDQ